VATTNDDMDMDMAQLEQGKNFRRKTAGFPENFPFPLVTGKRDSVIFRHFLFSNLKIQK
jgi:hypothetical protein